MTNVWRMLWVGLAVLVAACSDPAAPPAASGSRAAGAALETVPVALALVPRETTFDGVIEAVNQSTVAAQTSGRVVELPFDVGDYVAQGERIVRLTDTEQKARVEAARGALAEADARLAEATLTYERTREVFDKQLIARAQFDRAEADFESAQARHEAAQAALDEAQEALAHTVIEAPYAGTVVARHVQLGETVNPGTPLMTGVSLEHLRVVVDIPQQHVGPLRRHHQARVILPDGGSIEAADLRLPPGADPGTHTFRVLVTLPEGDHQLFPGTLVKVAFVSGMTERLLVPREAIVRRGEVTGAYVVDPQGRVQLRYVRLGSATGDGQVPVLSGLQAGDRVALDPIAAGIAYKQQTDRAGAEA